MPLKSLGILWESNLPLWLFWSSLTAAAVFSYTGLWLRVGFTDILSLLSRATCGII